MSIINPAKPGQHYVDAGCVEVEDMGVVTTKYGTKPMVKFTFQTDEVDEHGNKRRLTRLFHNHTHPMSSVSVAAKAWCDRDLEAEEESGTVDWQRFVGTPARLKLEPGTIKDGKRYENIVEILPLNEVEACEPKETK